MQGKLIFLTRDGCANTPLMRGDSMKRSSHLNNIWIMRSSI